MSLTPLPTIRYYFLSPTSRQILTAGVSGQLRDVVGRQRDIGEKSWKQTRENTG